MPVTERPSTARTKKATQLYNAAREGDKAHVKQLILCRADLEWQDFEKFTPLNVAAAHCFEGSGHVGCIRLLLEAGADKDAKTKGGKSALDWAQARGHESLIHLLEHPPRAAPATVYAAKPDPGFLLWDGANEGDADGVRELIASRASLEWKSIHGFTALHRAAASGHSACVRLLLREGANKDAVDAFGWTPLLRASGTPPTSGHEECVRLLLEARADRDAADKEGKTAIDRARDCTAASVVALLEQRW